MRRTLIPLLALAAASTLLTPARATTSHAVDIVDSAFEPAVLQAGAGDTITWTWKGSAGHNVTAYQGATFVAATRSTGTFSQTSPGGAVLYRCTIHSLLDAGGRCNGMCGVIAEDTTPPAAPTVSEPAAGSTVRSPVRIIGSAPGADRVIISENGVQRANVPVGQSGGWGLQLSMSDGAHTIEVFARNLLGIGGPATTRSFTVDATPPTVTISHPSDLSVVARPATIDGTAADERVLAAVTVTLTGIVGAPRTIAVVVTGNTWETSIPADLTPGIYTITATAADSAGNTRTTAPVRVVLA